MSWKKVPWADEVSTLSDTPPVDVDKAAASAGSAGEASRQDHKHGVATGTPGTIGENDTAAEGTATSLARSDHVHGSPASYTPSAHALDGHSNPTGSVDFNTQEAQNLLIEKVASLPGSPTESQVVYLTTDDHVYVYVAT